MREFLSGIVVTICVFSLAANYYILNSSHYKRIYIKKSEESVILELTPELVPQSFLGPERKILPKVPEA